MRRENIPYWEVVFVPGFAIVQVLNLINAFSVQGNVEKFIQVSSILGIVMVIVALLSLILWILQLPSDRN